VLISSLKQHNKSLIN